MRLLAENVYDFFFLSPLKTFILILALKDFDAEKFIARGHNFQFLLEAGRRCEWRSQSSVR